MLWIGACEVHVVLFPFTFVSIRQFHFLPASSQTAQQVYIKHGSICRYRALVIIDMPCLPLFRSGISTRKAQPIWQFKTVKMMQVIMTINYTMNHTDWDVFIYICIWYHLLFGHMSHFVEYHTVHSFPSILKDFKCLGHLSRGKLVIMSPY